MNVFDLCKGEPVRSLSWKQPYGSLMLFDKIETRTWNTEVRGWIVIATSQQPYKHEQVIRISGYHHAARIKQLADMNPFLFSKQVDGHAIAIGKLVDCRPMKLNDYNSFVEHHPELYGFVFEQVHKLIPHPWKGSQGFRMVSPIVQQSLILANGK